MFGQIGGISRSSEALGKSQEQEAQIKKPQTAQEWDEFRIRYDKFQRALDTAAAEFKADKTPAQNQSPQLTQNKPQSNSWASLLMAPQRAEPIWRNGR